MNVLAASDAPEVRREVPVSWIFSPEHYAILDTHTSHDGRYRLLSKLAQAYGMFRPRMASRLKIFPPKNAVFADLETFHMPEYVAKLQHPDRYTHEELEAVGLTDDCPTFQGLQRYVLNMAGATLTAVERILRGDKTVISWGGGRHHAQEVRVLTISIMCCIFLQRAPLYFLLFRILVTCSLAFVHVYMFICELGTSQWFLLRE
jgi:hypothetical protein